MSLSKKFSLTWRCFKFIYRFYLSNDYVYFIDKNECEQSPCRHNGTCINNQGSYKCDCTVGWKGKDCNTGTQEMLLYTYTPCVCLRDMFSKYHLPSFKCYFML